MFQMQRLCDAHHREWSEADQIVEARLAASEEARENLNLAREAAKVKCDQASASRQLVQKEKPALLHLREMNEPVVYTADELEAKHGLKEEETAKLQELENKLRTLDSVRDDLEIAALREKIELQGIRTQVAEAMYHKLLGLGPVLS